MTAYSILIRLLNFVVSMSMYFIPILTYDGKMKICEGKIEDREKTPLGSQKGPYIQTFTFYFLLNVTSNVTVPFSCSTILSN